MRSSPTWEDTNFRSRSVPSDDFPHPLVIDGFELAFLLKNGTIPELPNISKASILDRSKTDAFARWIAVLQFLWLILELIARQVEHLPSSQVEIVALAFACISVLTYMAVRDKPKDVEVPVEISVPSKLACCLAGSDEDVCQRSFIIDFLFFRGRDEAFQDWRAENQPGCRDGSVVRIPNDNYMMRPTPFYGMAGWLMIGNIVFSGIHCLAWNHYFPTSAERTLWRVSALSTLIIPLLIPIFHQSIFGMDNSLDRFKGGLFVGVLYVLTPPLLFLSYVVLRVCVVVLAFTSLRSMPAEVYRTTWTSYIVSWH